MSLSQVLRRSGALSSSLAATQGQSLLRLTTTVGPMPETMPTRTALPTPFFWRNLTLVLQDNSFLYFPSLVLRRQARPCQFFGVAKAGFTTF